MRIIVDSLVDRAVPGLAALVRSGGLDSEFHIFDSDFSPSRILVTIALCRPDVVIVDQSWLDVAPLLERALELSGFSPSCGLGATDTSDALKIRASRRGFVDIVDLGRPIGEVFEHIRQIRDGGSRLREDRLWVSVERLSPATNFAEVTSDSIDREIVELLSVGLSDREIASGVHLSLQAVRNRVSGMLERSGCLNRTQMGWLFSTHRLVDRMTEGLAPTSDG